ETEARWIHFHLIPKIYIQLISAALIKKARW
ncbi:MAG: hypothetical protein ACI8RD_012942, partial [Bacillariaceae sp.]